MNLALLSAFAALMVATRFNHFGDALHLPDASMALFFLGGLYLRRHWQFVALLALAVAVDWVSIEYAGVSDFCVTPSYAFLLPAYAVLWYGGRLYTPRLDGRIGPLLGAAGVGLVAASVSFLISNGAFYWLGGRYENPHFAEYLARAWQWGPLFVRTTMMYVAVALAVHGIVAFAQRGRAAHAVDSH
ncbi:membrane protein [Lysobacter maris]|nr:membrane protein [Lysobacter maris]